MHDALRDSRLCTRFWLGALLVCLLLPGCGGEAKKSLERETSNLKPLAILYGQYMSTHQGKAPGSEAEFKQFVASLAPQQLKALGVTDPGGLFISSRDEMPYVVFYRGAAGRAPTLEGERVIAHEQEGRGGMRYVATAMGAVVELDEARFDGLMSGR